MNTNTAKSANEFASSTTNGAARHNETARSTSTTDQPTLRERRYTDEDVGKVRLLIGRIQVGHSSAEFFQLIRTHVIEGMIIGIPRKQLQDSLHREGYEFAEVHWALAEKHVRRALRQKADAKDAKSTTAASNKGASPVDKSAKLPELQPADSPCPSRQATVSAGTRDTVYIDSVHGTGAPQPGMPFGTAALASTVATGTSGSADEAAPAALAMGQVAPPVPIESTPSKVHSAFEELARSRRR